MLFGEDFRGRHDGHLIAAGRSLGRREGRDHRFSAAHIALQQAVHGKRSGQVRRDFLDHAFLRRCEGKWQAGTQAGQQLGILGGKRLSALCPPSPPRKGQGKLLGQQLVKFDALPGRMLSFQQCLRRQADRWRVQSANRLREWRKAKAPGKLRGYGFGQIRLRQSLLNALAQYQLRYPIGAWVDRRQSIWKGFARLADPRVDNFRPIEPLPDFATNTYLLPGLYLTPLIGVKMQPAQVKASRAIRNGGHQLTARPQLNLAMENFAFNLNSAARHCGTDAVYASFV